MATLLFERGLHSTPSFHKGMTMHLMLASTVRRARFSAAALAASLALLPVVGDELYFYVSGRSGRPGGNKAGTLTTGLATLRRDGFASMDAGEGGGTLTTRPVRFSGRHLFVNVDDPEGELRVEVLDQAAQVVPGFTAENCIPVAADKTLQPVRWKGIEDLSPIANQPVRFRFRLKSGKLYAFWVSPENSGASQGYVAAGGPGFSSHRDSGPGKSN